MKTILKIALIVVILAFLFLVLGLELLGLQVPERKSPTLLLTVTESPTETAVPTATPTLEPTATSTETPTEIVKPADAGTVVTVVTAYATLPQPSQAANCACGFTICAPAVYCPAARPIERQVRYCYGSCEGNCSACLWDCGGTCRYTVRCVASCGGGGDGVCEEATP